MNQDLEIAIQLKERKSGLWTNQQLAAAGIGLVSTVYHWDKPRIGSLLCHFEVQQGAEFLSMLKVELVKAAYTGQEHAVLELPHISERLQYDSGVRRGLDVNRQGIEGNQALGQVVEGRRGLGLLAPILLLAMPWAVPWQTGAMTERGVVDC